MTGAVPAPGKECLASFLSRLNGLWTRFSTLPWSTIETANAVGRDSRRSATALDGHPSGSENDSPELVALLYDPIGEALRQSIRTFGQHLFDIYGSTAGMREVAERLAENAARHVPIIQILDLAWIGIGRESDSWAA